MMTQLAKRLTVVVLAGLLYSGLGAMQEAPAAGQPDEGLTTQFAALVLRASALLTPASAEAAVSKNKSAAKKKLATHQAGKTHKKKPKATVVTKKRLSKVTTVKRGKTRARKPSPGKVKTRRRQVISGRCEPQSLTYARERSGIMRSRTGRENGPITWFASEKRLGKTSDQPTSGSVLILGSNRRHGMSTGHVAYVEKAIPAGSSRYKVIFSHTNYDRKCSLETNIEALYDPATMTLDIASGAWQPWGKGLRVAGFIQQE